jgi:glycosyltransferase involved in cell wall biosynthesis
MRILFICDLNSIHSQKWIRYFIDRKADVYIYSTTAFAGDFLGARVFSKGSVVPPTSVANNKWASSFFKLPISGIAMGVAEKMFLRRKVSALVSSTDSLRDAIEEILPSIRPDMIHCLRIPNEGFIGAKLSSTSPLAVSTWGNDLAYWAQMPAFRKMTEDTLKRADFLFTDCERDVRLAHKHGFSDRKPFAVLPGAGGMMPEDLEAGKGTLTSRTDFFRENFGIEGRPILLSLRGFGSQDIDNTPLLKACTLLAGRGVDLRLVIAGKKNSFRYFKLQRFIKTHRLEGRVFLVDEMPHGKALEALRAADFSVSISRNDGTPNSMLEAMTFGAIPLMSDIESIREWIKDGVNGYLFDPRSPDSIASVIQRAFSETNKYLTVRERNHEIISKRAVYLTNMKEAERALEGLTRS